MKCLICFWLFNFDSFFVDLNSPRQEAPLLSSFSARKVVYHPFMDQEYFSFFWTFTPLMYTDSPFQLLLPLLLPLLIDVFGLQKMFDEKGVKFYSEPWLVLYEHLYFNIVL